MSKCTKFMMCSLYTALTCALGAFTLQANASQDIEAKLIEYLKNESPTPKAVAGTPESKMSAVFHAKMTDAIATKSTNTELPAHFVSHDGQTDKLVSLLKQKGAKVQYVDNDNVFAVAPVSVLQSVVADASVKVANLQGQVTQNNDLGNLLSQIGIGNGTVVVDGQAATNNQIQEITSSSSVRIRDANDEGLKLMNANLLHQKGMYGQGIKIGIIDFGYKGYRELQRQGIVPDVMDYITYYEGNPIDGLSVDSQSTAHGTAVAEIIYNMAPKAQFYLVQIGSGNGSSTDGDLLKAIKWLASQGVHIINFSGGGHNKQKDGTDAFSRLIDALSDKGVLWINSAGNEGYSHWRGATVDKDGNGFIDNNGKLGISFAKQANREGTIVVTWDDWQNKHKNIDINLYIADKKGNVVEKNVKRRNAFTEPLDEIKIPASLPAGQYILALTADQNNPNVHAHVQVYGGIKLDEFTPVGSVGVPATAKSALTVGAWDVVAGKYAAYTSWGPTDDNRLKPEISAPTNTESIAYNERFTGTSASAPYATGFAALLWSGHPNASAKNVKNAMISSFTRPVSQHRPSLATGYGVLDARAGMNSSSRNMQGSYTPTIMNPNQSNQLEDLAQPTSSNNSLDNLLRDLGVQ